MPGTVSVSRVSVKLAIILSSYTDFLSVKLAKIGCETMRSMKVRVHPASEQTTLTYFNRRRIRVGKAGLQFDSYGRIAL